MTETIIWHAGTGFFVGGAFIAFCTLVAERGNPVLAGVITGLPSTVLVALLVMAVTDSPSVAVEESVSAPAALGLNCVFLGVFGMLSGFGLWAALGGGLGVWLLLGMAWTLGGADSLEASLLVLVGGFVVGLLLTRGISSGAPACRPPSRILALLGRAFFGGAVIAGSILISYESGPVLGGLAAAFPATAVATLTIVGWSAGTAATMGMLRHIILANFITIGPYVLIVRWTYGTVGVVAGTLLAVMVSALAGWGLYKASIRCETEGYESAD